MDDLKAIVGDWLATNGFDGLAGDECGCGIDELFPCGDPSPDCRAAHHQTRLGCGKVDSCDEDSGCFYRHECDNGTPEGWGCYTTKKPEGRP